MIDSENLYRNNKARFKNFCKEYETKNKVCVLPISVGQRYHEGINLISTIDLINKSKFKKCVLVVADSLQRHTIKILENIEKGEAEKKSKNEGKKWVDRNSKIINKISLNFEIKFWDEWLKSDSYKLKKIIFEKNFLKSEFLKSEFFKTSKFYLDRLLKNNYIKEINSEKLEFSLEYLKEECTIMSMLWISEGFDYIIYPSDMTPAISASFYINNTNLKWLAIRFEKTKEKNFKETI